MKMDIHALFLISENSETFILKFDVSCRFFIDALIRLKKFPAIPTLLKRLLWICDGFCQMFCACLVIWVFFLYFIHMKNHIDWHFVKDFYTQVCERYWSVVLFSCDTFVWFCYSIFIFLWVGRKWEIKQDKITGPYLMGILLSPWLCFIKYYLEFYLPSISYFQILHSIINMYSRVLVHYTYMRGSS